MLVTSAGHKAVPGPQGCVGEGAGSQHPGLQDRDAQSQAGVWA